MAPTIMSGVAHSVRPSQFGATQGGGIMAGSGGADGAAGLRFQHLVTIEALLDAFEADPGGDWRIGVDVRGQDAADYVLIRSAGAAPEVAVQVKASSPTSSTQMTRPDVISMLSALEREHPGSGRFEVRTNRRLTGPAQQVASALRAGGKVEGLPVHVARVSTVRTEVLETLESIADRLRGRILTYRAGTNAEVAGNITQLVLSRLRDLVDEKATAAKDQFIDASMVADVLRLPGQQLAQASGGRQYGRLLGLPISDVIHRDQVTTFLDAELGGSSAGVPRVAVVVGAAGAGKSSAVSGWVKQNSERLFCAIWLAAGSEELLQAQVPALLEQLGETFDPSVPPAQALRKVLGTIPLPWLLVLDGAPSMSAITQWLPTSGFGDVIITSQDSTWPASHARVVPIGSFTENETAQLVRHRLGTSADPVQTASDDIARLAKTMGYWPLAIDMACHWIARRGGRLSNLQDYLDRLDDVDLDEAQSVPAGYSGTAVAAIMLAWDDLSEPARAIVTLGLLCGGDDVPLDALWRACEMLPEEFRPDAFEQEAVLEELSSSSLITRFLKDSRDGDAPGRDRIAVHESLRLVGDGRWEYPGAYLLALSNALDGRSRPLRDEARIQAAASYLPASTSVLRFATALFDPEQQARFAPALHNAGDLLLLTGAAEQAALWLNHAASVYAARIDNESDPALGLMEYFLGSAGRLTTALSRTQYSERVYRVVEFACDLAERHPAVVSSPVAQVAFVMMADALQVVGSSSAELAARLHKLQRTALLDDQIIPTTAFAGWSLRLAEAADTALILVQQERWGAALDSFLMAANAARDKGAMQHEIVETGIRVGFALLISRQQRLLAQPPARWDEAWRRFGEWHASLEDLEPHQQARLTILTRAPEESPPLDELRDALHVVEDHRNRPLTADEITMWRIQVENLERSRVAALPWEMFSDELLAGGTVELTRMHDGGSDVMVWVFISPTGLPAVAFVNISATVNRGQGWEDPHPEALQRAGFPRHDPSQPRLAIPDGWSATVIHHELRITDADGEPCLTTDLRDYETYAQWRTHFDRAKVLHVIYGDIGGILIDDLHDLPYQAAVRIRRHRWWWPWSR